MTLVAVGRSADRRRVGVAGGAPRRGNSATAPGRRGCGRAAENAARSPGRRLERSVTEVVSVRPKSKLPRARLPRSQCAPRDMLITDGGGTPTPCTMAVVIIRPQAAVQDKHHLPVAVPARGSFVIADLASEASGFDSDPCRHPGMETLAGVYRAAV